MTEQKQIEEMRSDLIEIFDEEYEKRRLITPQNTAEKLTAKGYRKQIEGEWVAKDNFNGRCSIATCSNCGTKKVLPALGTIEMVTKAFPYCEKCGAKMKGDSNGRSC